jgi:hypothetical protein
MSVVFTVSPLWPSAKTGARYHPSARQTHLILGEPLSSTNFNFPPSSMNKATTEPITDLLSLLSRWSISFHSEEIHHVTNPTDHFSCAADDRSGPAARRRPLPCHLTMDSRLDTFLTSSSSTPSCSKDPWSSPAEPTSTPPPPPLLTIDKRHRRVEAEPSSSCPTRRPLDARACPARVGAPRCLSRRRPPRHRACSAYGDYRRVDPLDV